MSLAADPRLRLAPGRIGLTGLTSFFWVRPEPRPVVATAAAGGFTVTARATPVEYVWDFGDGPDRVTGGPGRPWTRRRDGNVGHLYESRGTYDISVEVVWRATWRSSGRGWRPLGYFTTATTRDYKVREMVAMLDRKRR